MSGKNKIFPMKFQWCQGILENLSGIFISPNWQLHESVSSYDESVSYIQNCKQLLLDICDFVERKSFFE